MFKKKVLVVIAILMVTASINAQGLYVGPQLGWQKASSADAGKVMFGAAARIKLSDALGIEGSINYRQEDYNNGDVTVTSYPVMVTGMFYPISIVYGAIGFGWYNTSFAYSSSLHQLGITDQTEQKVGWHFGAGVELPLSGSVSSPNTILTADIRYVFLNYAFQQFPGSDNLKSDFIVITVGLLFSL